MRVYTRGTNQSLFIDNRFVVTVLEISSDRVRLGISSPHTEPCYREVDLTFSDDDDGSQTAESTDSQSADADPRLIDSKLGNLLDQIVATVTD